MPKLNDINLGITYIGAHEAVIYNFFGPPDDWDKINLFDISIIYLKLI